METCPCVALSSIVTYRDPATQRYQVPKGAPPHPKSKKGVWTFSGGGDTRGEPHASPGWPRTKPRASSAAVDPPGHTTFTVLCLPYPPPHCSHNHPFPILLPQLRSFIYTTHPAPKCPRTHQPKHSFSQSTHSSRGAQRPAPRLGTRLPDMQKSLDPPPSSSISFASLYNSSFIPFPRVINCLQVVSSIARRCWGAFHLSQSL